MISKAPVQAATATAVTSKTTSPVADSKTNAAPAFVTAVPVVTTGAAISNDLILSREREAWIKEREGWAKERESLKLIFRVILSLNLIEYLLQSGSGGCAEQFRRLCHKAPCLNNLSYPLFWKSMVFRRRKMTTQASSSSWSKRNRSSKSRSSLPARSTHSSRLGVFVISLWYVHARHKCVN